MNLVLTRGGGVGKSLSFLLMGFVSIALFLGCLMAARFHVGAVLLAPAVIAGGIVVIAACQARPWAMKACMIAFIVTIDASLRPAAPVQAGMDGQVLMKMAIMAGILVVGLANLPASFRYIRSLPAVPLLAYLLLAVASTAYSVVPQASLTNALSFVGVLLFAGALAARLEFRAIIATALLGTGIHVVLAIALAVLNVTPVVWMVTGDGGTIVRLKGLTGHGLRFAEMAAIFVISAWLMWLRGLLSTWMLTAVAALGAAALIMAHQRMPIIALLVALLSLGRYRPIGLTALVAMVLAVFLLSIVAPTSIEQAATAISRSGNANEVLTLSGRLDIWRRTIDAFLNEPVVGHGFATAGRVLNEGVVQRPGITPLASAEGVFTQSLIGMGLIGTALLVAAFAGQLAFVMKHRDSVLNPLLCFAFLTGLTTSSTIGAAPNMLTLVWMVALCLIGPAARRRSDAPLLVGTWRGVPPHSHVEPLAASQRARARTPLPGPVASRP